MRRSLSALFVVAVAGFACVNVNDSGPQQLLVVSPVLDSVFVGDTLPARSVYLVDAAGNQSSAGPITWSASPSSVATVDANGKVAGVGKGAAVVVATRTDGVQSGAVVIVSRPVELTLLMDTVYLMPGDTFTVPVAIKEKTPGSPTLAFDPSPDGTRYTIDANGQVTAVGAGGAVRYVVHLSDGAA
ncbi:MAG TPA: Ig-like domain-containing protein, partial [Gemmatimonadales bacterium]|nr:Ig-like domain-containing protein [Gemmatimonadales bacterium]